MYCVELDGEFMFIRSNYYYGSTKCPQTKENLLWKATQLVCPTQSTPLIPFFSDDFNDIIFLLCINSNGKRNGQSLNHLELTFQTL